MRNSQAAARVDDITSSFRKVGVCSPVSVLNATELAFFSAKMNEFLYGLDWKLNAVSRHKPHLYLKWANDLGRHPKILESVRSILGPDVLMWYSVVFVKPAHSDGVVPWHQDSTFWALERDEGVTAWLALSDVNEANGCVKYIPGSHLDGQREHVIESSATNLLARGQLIRNLKTESAQPIILKAGECSLHDPRLLHCSEANASEQPRLGIAFRYISASNAPRTLRWLRRSATLVSGEWKHQKFVVDPLPSADYEPRAMVAHRRSVRVAAIHTLFGDTSRSLSRKIADLLPILFTKRTLGLLRSMGVPVEQNNDS